jgi:hypothetical protein
VTGRTGGAAREHEHYKFYHKGESQNEGERGRRSAARTKKKGALRAPLQKAGGRISDTLFPFVFFCGLLGGHGGLCWAAIVLPP